MLKILFFGSRVRNEASLNSDIDIALVTNNNNHKTFIKFVSDIDESNIPYRVDLVLIV